MSVNVYAQFYFGETKIYVRSQLQQLGHSVSEIPQHKGISALVIIDKGREKMYMFNNRGICEAFSFSPKDDDDLKAIIKYFDANLDKYPRQYQWSIADKHRGRNCLMSLKEGVKGYSFIVVPLGNL